jgi:hypothetical protein
MEIIGWIGHHKPDMEDIKLEHQPCMVVSHNLLNKHSVYILTKVPVPE